MKEILHAIVVSYLDTLLANNIGRTGAASMKTQHVHAYAYACSATSN